MPRFRLVTFDVTNTILQFKNSVGVFYADAMRKFGVIAEPDVVSSSFKKAFKNQNIACPNFGYHNKITAEEWWKEVVTNTVRLSSPSQINIEVISQVSQHLYDYYNTKDAWTVSPGCEETLKNLNNNGICVGVISNFDNRLFNILREFNLEIYFKFIISSYACGYHKPQRKIFELAEQKAGLGSHERSQILHVGDDVQYDYFGALNVGWNSFLYLGDRQLDSTNTPIFEIGHGFKNFNDLQNIICG